MASHYTLKGQKGPISCIIAGSISTSKKPESKYWAGMNVIHNGHTINISGNFPWSPLALKSICKRVGGVMKLRVWLSGSVKNNPPYLPIHKMATDRIADDQGSAIAFLENPEYEKMTHVMDELHVVRDINHLIVYALWTEHGVFTLDWLEALFARMEPVNAQCAADQADDMDMAARLTRPQVAKELRAIKGISKAGACLLIDAVLRMPLDVIKAYMSLGLNSQQSHRARKISLSVDTIRESPFSMWACKVATFDETVAIVKSTAAADSHCMVKDLIGAIAVRLVKRSGDIRDARFVSGSTCIPLALLASLVRASAHKLNFTPPSLSAIEGIISNYKMLDKEYVKWSATTSDHPDNARPADFMCIKDTPPTSAVHMVYMASMLSSEKLLARYAVNGGVVGKSAHMLPPSCSLDSTIVPTVALTAEQLGASRTALSNRVSLIVGAAGTGKSTVCAHIVRSFLDDPENTHVVLAAPTGAAAKRLTECVSDRIGLRLNRMDHGDDSDGECRLLAGRTLHSVIYSAVLCGNAKNTLLVIDESSLMDLSLAARVFSYNWKHIVLLGDDRQLPPVGVGAPFISLMSSEMFPTTRLTAVKRQSEGSGVFIAASGALVNRLVPNCPNFTTHQCRDRSSAVKVTVDQVVELTHANCFSNGVVVGPNRSVPLTAYDLLPQVLTCSNADAMALSTEIRDVLFPKRVSDTANNTTKIAISRGADREPLVWELRVHDRVLISTSMDAPVSFLCTCDGSAVCNCTQREGSVQRTYHVANGDVGTVHSIFHARKKGALLPLLRNIELAEARVIEAGGVPREETKQGEISETYATIELDDGGFIDLTRASMCSSLRPAYAVTVHRSQGNEYPHVIYYDTSGRWVSNAHVYTAITRAKDGMVIVTTGEVEAHLATPIPARVSFCAARMHCESSMDTQAPEAKRQRR
jgi:hypothetical protein